MATENKETVLTKDAAKVLTFSMLQTIPVEYVHILFTGTHKKSRMEKMTIFNTENPRPESLGDIAWTTSCLGHAVALCAIAYEDEDCELQTVGEVLKKIQAAMRAEWKTVALLPFEMPYDANIFINLFNKIMINTEGVSLKIYLDKSQDHAASWRGSVCGGRGRKTQRGRKPTRSNFPPSAGSSSFRGNRGRRGGRARGQSHQNQNASDLTKEKFE
ncbi:uncharacterized protein LOC113391184 [Ctenocephalides felis]|uniref:uncharacterized protein LOC113391184 n=1 Tax=Ctenocephalides felis TaxID=7515 RepID=UPI000E6E28EA|nr:uncharacterized protein LOC113391184 [Ctenocephalides felis]